MLGGLSRISTVLNNNRTHSPASDIFISPGNVLFDTDRGKYRVSTSKAESILLSLQQMNIQALAVGPYDLAAGMDFLIRANAFFPHLLSLNIYSTTKTNSVFKPSIDINLDRITIKVIGITDPSAPLEPGFYYSDYNLLLSNLLDETPQSVFVILLSSLPVEKNFKLLDTYPKIDLLLSSDKDRYAIGPTIYNHSLISQSANRGRYVDLLQIQPGKKNQWATSNNGMVETVKRDIANLKQELKKAENKNKETTKLQDDTKDIQQIKKRIQRYEDELLQLTTADKANQGNTHIFEYTQILVDDSIPNHQAIEKILIGGQQ